MKMYKRFLEGIWQKPIGDRPAFYLVYLAFYFFPWLVKAPTSSDIIAVAVSIAVFLPIYFHGYKQTGLKLVPHVAAMSLIGFAVSPFFGAHGVFHIYAMVQSGLLRPAKTAWLVAVITSAIFSLFSWLTHQTWWDHAFPLFMGFVTIVGTIANAATIEKNSQLERSRELDQHLAAVAERERIAQDLHDLLGQTLTMVALKSEVATKLFDKKPKQAKQELQEIRDAARTALTDVREAVAGMNKTSLKAELKRAHQILASAGIDLKVSGAMPELNIQSDQVLGLTVREIMTNIVRHSSAQSATLIVEEVKQQLVIVVKDDGIAGIINEGSGLTGLRKRIETLGGNTKLELTPGLKISIKIPNWKVVK